MVSFQYVEFYDVPRNIALKYKGKLLLLQSVFDEGTDDYENNYSVYLLPESFTEQLSRGSWKFIEELALEPLGQIPVKSVRFDSSIRKKLDASILNQFIT